MIAKFVIWWLSRQYSKLKNNKTIFYINGTEKDYPKYLLYTENERVRKILEEI